MNTKLRVFLLTFTLAAPLSADVLFSENFQSYPSGSVLGSPWSLSVPDNGSTLTYRIATDTSDLFGQGTSNKYLSLHDGVSGAPNIQFYRTVSTPSTIGQISFSFYDPLTSTTGGANNTGLLVRLGTSTTGAAGNSTSPFGIFVSNGGIYTNSPGSSSIDTNNLLATYDTSPTRTAQELSIVFNNGTTDITYGDGDIYSLAAGRMDIWLNGIVVASGLTKFNNNTSTDGIGNVTFNGQSSGEFNMYLDDISYLSNITIPEPSNFAFIIGGVLCLVFTAQRLRRRA
ncbi:hypothetical protein H5P28_17890 [Ruficoccus amylovorans]|uniref:PEP-CTERM protein-sorting domain-containing protein n=1 Tax=Ruficoccus amylovorans TaxID=1804625 RepID=A0A842HHZ1_9BACT|nr:hypothetical protein [Ruficoccus amylovorans]MBC2596143.1 hypothetical protein [Ruficoccus amylovorans]